MRNAGLEEAQAGIKTPGRNINHLRYACDGLHPANLKKSAVSAAPSWSDHDSS